MKRRKCLAKKKAGQLDEVALQIAHTEKAGFRLQNPSVFYWDEGEEKDLCVLVF